MQKLVWFLRSIFEHPAPLIDKVWFVVTASGAKTIGKRLHAALTHRPDSGYPRQIRELDARILNERLAIFQLDANRLEPARLPWQQDSIQQLIIARNCVGTFLYLNRSLRLAVTTRQNCGQF